MTIKILQRDGKHSLAYHYSEPSASMKTAPIVMFCGGYRSDMNGTKATYFEQQCRARGQGYIRFDYSGHGESEGVFRDGTIGEWADDARSIFDEVLSGPVLLVGSSMGGWIALLVAASFPKRVHGLIGIAAAPDFTEDMYHERLNDAQRDELFEKGIVFLENDYSDEPYEFTRAFYEDGKAQCVLNSETHLPFPVHLFQGKKDADVPWETAMRIQRVYGTDTVDITFINDGDHRLSRDEDLALIDQKIREMSGI